MNSNDYYDNWDSISDFLQLDSQSRSGPDQLRNWALVLSSRNIPHKLTPKRKPADLLVPAHHMNIAIHEISLYLNENKTPPEKPRELKLSNNAMTTLAILALLGIFHNVTYFKLSGLGHENIDWLMLGSADSTRILSGEWWRILTSLTLHADGQHLLGNLLIGGYFVVRLCQLTGTGLGWTLILGAGTLGNLINAIVHGDGHNAVGASTGIFGAIGIAGALGTVMSHRRQFRYWLMPLAAACVLLAFLGAGSGDSRTDIGAHLFGFISGIGLGIPAAFLIERKGQLGAIGNGVLSALLILVVATAWVVALV